MASASREPLLSEKGYDDDTAMIPSDPQTDETSDSEAESNGDTPNLDDRRLLDQPEEDARLLTKPSRFGGIKHAFRDRQSNSTEQQERQRKRTARKAKKLKKQAHDGQSSEVVYEMEEGFKDTSSTSSSEIDFPSKEWQTTERTGLPLTRVVPFGVAILIVFVGFFFASYRASKHHPQSAVNETYNNGTHSFAATTILISLDGFRADFLRRGLTPAMNVFIQSGVSPKYMLPSFPSVTFPNHYTLVTGLYPESHGIVSNQFWDPDLEEEFYYTDVAHSMQAKWWESAEPLWVTAEKQGVRTAVHMWPGSEAHIHGIDPTHLDKFNEHETLSNKVDRVLGLLDLEQGQRPQLIAAYVPNVDADGHKYGPNSTEIRGTIADADSMLTLLVEGLLQRNLTEIVNLVVVSDHGMATTSNDRLIQLEDFIDTTLIDHIDGWPLRGLRLKNPDRDVPILYQQLLKASQQTDTFEIYTLETMPERYHFSNNRRIAPLWVVPKTGWAVVEKSDFDVVEAKKNGLVYEPKGLHGYDHEHPLMRAIFIARGPAFPHAGNSRVPVFQNTEVYNIICDSIGVEPHPNNGTLRLPLKTQGLHSDFNDDEGLPADPVLSPSSVVATSHTFSSEPTTAVAPVEDDNASPENDKSGSDELKSKSDWWKFMHDQLEKAKEWAKNFLEGISGKKSSDNNNDE